MRIAIDLQGAQNGSRFRGIGRYSTSFTKQFIIEARQHEIILVLNGAFADTILPIRAEFSTLLPSDQIRVWHPITPAHHLDKMSSGRRLASESIREYFLASLKPDVVLVTSMIEGSGDDVVTSIGVFEPTLPTAAILYDLIPLIYKDQYLADVQVAQWYEEKIAHIKRADLLLAISESSRREAINYLELEEKNVVTISTAIDTDFGLRKGSSPIALANKFSVSRPFVMYSGASDMRKNLPRLLEAFSMLPRQLRDQHHLVLAGGMQPDHLENLKCVAVKLGLNASEVIFTGHISDDDMIGFYRTAVGLILPSYHEGFGLPILEAMAFDLPVIASNVTSMPEVIGDKSALFDPLSVSSISSAIERLLTDKAFRERLVENGRDRRQRFSWKKTACAALSELEARFGQKPNGDRNTKGVSDAKEEEREHALRRAVAAQITRNGHLERGDLVETAKAIDAVLPRVDSAKRLFIDVSELAERDSKSGIQRVVRNIVRAVLASPPKGFKVELVRATRKAPYVIANKFARDAFGLASWNAEDLVLDTRPGDIFLGLDFQDQIIYDQRKYYDELRRIGVGVYFVVYDILPQQQAGIFIPEVTKNHAKWLDVVGASDGLVCISKTVAKEVKEWLHMFGPIRETPIKLGWFHLGAELDGKLAKVLLPDTSMEVLAKLGQRPTFLSVSTIEPRKRQDQILGAFETLWEKGCDLNLVLVGTYGWLSDKFEERMKNHAELNQRLFWLQGISDLYLEELYRSSSCLIAASIGEGFGLPLIEAAKRNLPIIARDIPVFREVAGMGAFYFAGMSSESLAAAISEWLLLSKLGKIPQPSAIRCLDWSESAEQLLELILGWQTGVERTDCTLIHPA